jgi:hypothetical protein
MRRGQTSMGPSTGTPKIRSGEDGSVRLCVLQNSRPTHDTGFDGHYGAGDSSAICGWAMTGDPYRGYADVDLDRHINSTDARYTTNQAMGWGVLCSSRSPR